MSRERMVLIGLAVLTIGALLFAGAAAGQRSAWMEGYMMGRLSAVSTGAEAGAGAAAAAMLPYGPYGVGFAHRGPGFGGVLLLILGVGAVAFFVSRFAHRARWARWQAWMATQGAQQGGAQSVPQDWRHGPPPPWMHGPWGRGPWGQGGWGREPWPAQPAAPAEQGQPSQPAQPPAGEPGTER